LVPLKRSSCDLATVDALINANRDAEAQLSRLMEEVSQARQSAERAKHDVASQEERSRALQAKIDRATQQLALAEAAVASMQEGITRLRVEQELDRDDLSRALAAAGHDYPEFPARWLDERRNERDTWRTQQAKMEAHRRHLPLLEDQIRQARDAAAQRRADWHAQGGGAELPPLPDQSAPDTRLNECGKTIDALAAALQALSGRVEALLDQLKQSEEREANAATAYTQALTQSPFPDEAAFLAALLAAPELERLQARKTQLDNDLLQARTLLEAATAHAEALAQRALCADDLEALRATESELAGKSEALSVRLGEIGERLKTDADVRQQQAGLLAEVSRMQLDVDLWQRLNSLIGSADGKKYRRFAQGLTLDHLLVLANRQLQRLHARYVLRRRGGSELGLEIVDTWHGDQARDTRTLSGGESFLVSLALALGLSDLVSHKTSIDSLFLDEGFGTLDGETLEVALNALDSLNASGKMIGVISHIEAMKERIPVQIQVRKSPGVGYSTLTVVE
jgi:exonuclease SbcC